jgi:hypothetical protein
MVKGHFQTTEATIFASYDAYFYRMWHNEEGYLHEEGFEEAYREVLRKKCLIALKNG